MVDKENKSSRSRQNKSAVISHCYATREGSTGNRSVPLKRGTGPFGEVMLRRFEVTAREVKACVSVRVRRRRRRRSVAPNVTQEARKTDSDDSLTRQTRRVVTLKRVTSSEISDLIRDASR